MSSKAENSWVKEVMYMEPPLTLIETEVKWPRFENIASVPDETVIIFNLVNQKRFYGYVLIENQKYQLQKEESLQEKSSHLDQSV